MDGQRFLAEMQRLREQVRLSDPIVLAREWSDLRLQVHQPEVWPLVQLAREPLDLDAAVLVARDEQLRREKQRQRRARPHAVVRQKRALPVAIKPPTIAVYTGGGEWTMAVRTWKRKPNGARRTESPSRSASACGRQRRVVSGRQRVKPGTSDVLAARCSRADLGEARQAGSRNSPHRLTD